jgi:hypothetical protein
MSVSDAPFFLLVSMYPRRYFYRLYSSGESRREKHYLHPFKSISQRVVVLKDVANKAAYESSAQVACEAAGAIRTVASLTREVDCSRIYNESLQEPIRRSRRSMIGSSLLYAISQSIA